MDKLKMFEMASGYTSEDIILNETYDYTVVMKLKRSDFPRDIKHAVREFEIRKTKAAGFDQDFYYMIIENDPVPVIIHEDTMLRFYQDRAYAVNYAYTMWNLRYQ